MTKNIEMQYYDGSTYEVCYPICLMTNVSGILPVVNGGTGNSSVDTVPTSGSTKMCTSGGIYTALESVKTSVSNGKFSIASAITDKGISTSGTDSFDIMANNIRSLKTSSYYVWEKYNSISQSVWGTPSVYYTGRFMYDSNYDTQGYEGSLNSYSDGQFIATSSSPNVYFTYPNYNKWILAVSFRKGGGWADYEYSVGIDRVQKSSYLCNFTYPSLSAGCSGTIYYIPENIVYSKGSNFYGVITSKTNDYPSNGRHTDGYWYILV